MKPPPQNVAAKQPPLPAPAPAAAPSAPVSVAAAAPSNEIAMNGLKAEAVPRAQAMRPGASRALKGSVEAFGAEPDRARGAPAANVAARPPATTTPGRSRRRACFGFGVSRGAGERGASTDDGQKRDGCRCRRNACGAGAAADAGAFRGTRTALSWLPLAAAAQFERVQPQ